MDRLPSSSSSSFFLLFSRPLFINKLRSRDIYRLRPASDDVSVPRWISLTHTKGFFFLAGSVKESFQRKGGKEGRKEGRKEGLRREWEKERETEDRLKEYGMEEKSLVWPTLARVTRCSLLLIDQPLREVARFFSTFFFFFFFKDIWLFHGKCHSYDSRGKEEREFFSLSIL